MTRAHMKTYLDLMVEKREREAREEGRRIGREEGRKIGREEGRRIGRKEAELEQTRKRVSLCFEQYGDRSQELRKQIESLNDIQLLDSIFTIFVQTRSRSFKVLEKKIADLLAAESKR